MGLDLDLVDKDFKSAIVNMFKELNETMSKELKYLTKENSNKHRNYFKRAIWKFWSLKV